MTDIADLKYKILAHPLRRALLRTLKEGDRTLAFLARTTGASPSRTSNHLRLMEQAGLIRARKEGRRRVYSLRAESLREMADFLKLLSE
jgi:DNA-binding transcriptional ArsR family regulator